jgi:predicted nuclease of predicted toxin-antitoxin system
MRFLADENFPKHGVETLRELGHEVSWVRIDAPGSSDPAVLRRATADERVLITLDKDFGNLAVRHGLPASSGVVLIRVGGSAPPAVSEAVRRLLGSGHGLAGKFTVVQGNRIRQRTLPGSDTPSNQATRR